MHALHSALVRRRWIRVSSLLLVLLLCFGVPTLVRATQLDATAVERRACQELIDDLQFDAAYERLMDLWEQKQSAMDDEARIDVLQKLAYVFIAWNDPDNAQKCYESILSIQRDWLPENFSSQNEMIRKPILAAYEARGFTPYTVSFRNIGVAEVRVSDNRRDAQDWSVLERSLPDFILTYLGRELDQRTCGGEGRPMRVIDRIARDDLVARAQSASDSGAVAPSFTELQAVHGLLDLEVLLLGSQAAVSVRVVRTDNAEVVAPWTGSGEVDELMDLVQQGMVSVVGHLCEGAILEEDEGVASLGELQVAVQALHKIDEAMELARRATDPIDLEKAIELVEEAREISPGSDDLALQLEELREQLEDMNVAQANIGRDVPRFDPGN